MRGRRDNQTACHRRWLVLPQARVTRRPRTPPPHLRPPPHPPPPLHPGRHTMHLVTHLSTPDFSVFFQWFADREAAARREMEEQRRKDRGRARCGSDEPPDAVPTHLCRKQLSHLRRHCHTT
ncbi:hypothetical protein E2C01_101198 [Portunus trituberculatus]|uniref:Uncharacterized protein n=1 Tax=Portunus trituberculatus TaxID=210409 RepID=A0A5B7KA13_PORTR|nr:hypothetical protein [Portunus trituberculatus]